MNGTAGAEGSLRKESGSNLVTRLRSLPLWAFLQTGSGAGVCRRVSDNLLGQVRGVSLWVPATRFFRLFSKSLNHAARHMGTRLSDM